MCSDYEPSDVWRETVRCARKEHRCDECPRRIPPGERYTYIASLYDHRWYTLRVCAFCAAAGRWLEIVCGGRAVGNLSGELAEHWDESHLYRSHWLGRAVIGVRRGWSGFAAPLPDPGPMLAGRGLATGGRGS